MGDAAQRFEGGVGEVVDHHDGVVNVVLGRVGRVEEGDERVGADVAAASGDEDSLLGDGRHLGAGGTGWDCMCIHVYVCANVYLYVLGLSRNLHQQRMQSLHSTTKATTTRPIRFYNTDILMGCKVYDLISIYQPIGID